MKRLAVQVASVGGPQVLDNHPKLAEIHLAMMAGDRGIIDGDVVVRLSSHAEGSVRQLHGPSSEGAIFEMELGEHGSDRLGCHNAEKLFEGYDALCGEADAGVPEGQHSLIDGDFLEDTGWNFQKN